MFNFEEHGINSLSSQLTTKTLKRGSTLQASDGYLGCVIHILVVRNFAAMGRPSLNPHAQFLEHLAEWTGGLHRLEKTLTLSSVNDGHPSGSSVLIVRLKPPTSRLTELLLGGGWT